MTRLSRPPRDGNFTTMTSLAQLMTAGSFPLSLDEPFTRAEANRAGIPDRQLRALVKECFVRNPIRAVYVSTLLPDDLDLRVRILAKVVPEGCFVADRTAGWLHGANMILAPNDHLQTPRVSLFHPAGQGRTRLAIADSGERDVRSEDLMSLGDVLVTTPLRTALDLGRSLHRAQALAAMDALLRLGVFDLAQLLANVERFAKRRGVRQLRFLAPLADGRSASPGESATRLHWWDAGLPRPELQIPHVEHGREVYYLDMGLPELRFAAEYDGEKWHSEREDVEHDRRRRAYLRRVEGWQIEEFRRENVYGLQQDADWTLRDAIVVARDTFDRRTRHL